MESELLRQIKSATTTNSTDLPPGLTLKDGLLHHQDLIFVPESARSFLFQSMHDHPLAGHFGAPKTLQLIQRNFWWPTLRRDCFNYVRSCDTCARSKPRAAKPPGQLMPLPVPDRPWDKISMDFIVELPSSQNHNTIWVVVDRFTKMAHFVPLKGLPSASELAELFIQHIIRLHGLPSDIVSDRGSQFIAKFWTSFCKSLRISVSLSSAYHPQSNGQTERVNQVLEQYLRCYTTFLQDDWLRLLPLAEFAYNNTVHSSSQMSPFYANYGFYPKCLPDVPGSSGLPAVADLTNRLHELWTKLKENLLSAQEFQKEFSNRRRGPNPPFKVGDYVWLSSRNLKLSCPSKKLGPKFLGPFKILQQINPVAFKLLLPISYRIHPVFHCSLLKPAPAGIKDLKPPDPIVVQGEEEYLVEKVLDSRFYRSGIQYLIKWLGYGSEENSWEPSRNVHAPQLVRDFHLKYPNKPAPSRARRSRLGGGAM